MSGQGGLNCDFCSFEVADFTYKNDVWILPQECAQRGRKVQADLLLHLHLIDAAELKLNRIFSGHDVRIRCVQPRNRGVQSVGLS